MAVQTLSCVSCGADNPSSLARCDECGATLESLAPLTAAPGSSIRPPGASGAAGAQGGKSGKSGTSGKGGAKGVHSPLDAPVFAFGWFMTALVLYGLLLGIAIVGLPFVISAYDPQGFPGLAIAMGIWFVGGLVLGRLAPYHLYVECFGAAVVTSGLVIPYIAYISDVRAMDGGSYVLAGMVGALSAGLGAFFGERRVDAMSVGAAR